jgi:chemotaxis signal transduction protein
MLASGLPGRTGAFAAFADREGRVVSSTHPGYPPGSLLRPDTAAFTQQNGASGATVAVHDGHYTMLGHTTSFGYREYKNSGDYENDVIALVCVPIGAAVPATTAGAGPQAAGTGAATGERTQRDGQAQEFALFSMNEALFALAASDVVEAIDAAKLRRTAVLPTPLAGMVNFTLAGSDGSVLVPVIDMRQVIQGGTPQQPPQAEVIVVRNGARMFGILVETLGDVLSFDSGQIEPAPRMVQGENGYVGHIVKSGAHGQMIQVLDVARIGQVFDAA